jgi:peptide/nickel transport system substrate-binding protein
MDRPVISRRGALALVTASAAAWAASSAEAMGRLPLGGSLTMHLPHDTSRLDPHDLFDPLAALMGASVFDPIFRLDPNGNPYPSLSDGLPKTDGRVTRVRLRPGLHSARGRLLLGSDLVHSLERARSLGAAAVLQAIPRPRVDPKDGRAVVFVDTDPIELALALASPIVALVSTRSTPTQPDGTGAFRAEPSAERIVLERNNYAARGPSYLRDISITRADDLKDPLRAFEARQADIGWLGAFLHQPRSDAVPFDLGEVGWVVLRTGREAGSWGAPGVAQGLVDGIPPERLAHLALGPMPTSAGQSGWGGARCQLLAPARSSHLIEVARTLASILSRPGHEVELAVVSQADLAARRASRAFALMVDVVRPIGPPGIATLVALTTADDATRAREIAKRPPRLTTFAPHGHPNAAIGRGGCVARRRRDHAGGSSGDAARGTGLGPGRDVPTANGLTLCVMSCSAWRVIPSE